MTSIAATARDVIGGVDTHQDLHVAALVEAEGTLLGTRAFPTTRAGYRALLAWMRSHGSLLRVGVESTGSYGAGLTRHLALAGVTVLEVTGPARAARRGRGKDDMLDAIAAARAAASGQRVQVAKSRLGAIEALRVLRTTRRTAVKSRRAALQLLHNTIVSAPDAVRDEFRSLTRMQLIRTLAASRPSTVGFRDPTVATRIALRSIARRILDLNDEIGDLDRLIEPLVAELAPGLVALDGVGTECAAELLVAAGDNPERLRSEASFAMLCGVSPIPASSGKTQRHRLNRGGNRQANSALHMIVISRMRLDARTKTYVARRVAEGLQAGGDALPQALRGGRSSRCSPARHALDKHESVRGSQYTAWAFGQRLRAAGLLGSMGRVASALDNSMMESFFGTLQLELLDRQSWTTRAELARAIFEWIEGWYNPRRRHTSIGDLSPVDYERRPAPTTDAA